VLDRADGVLLEGRERVRDLRQDEISANELQARLVACGEELRQNHAIPFSLSVIGTPQPLDPTVGNEVYGIGQEALTNAFQHSKSSKIEVEITYDHNRLRLSVRDDGVGIDQDLLLRGKDGHWGLVGMRERTQKIGGQLKIWSQEGAGTEIELAIPAAIAYTLYGKTVRWHWIKRLLGVGE
jgi:signal transduction histidine kinase